MLIVLPAGAAEPRLPAFTDVTVAAGIQFKHSFGDAELSNIVEGTGAGCMFFDYDNDGWLDIYLVNGRYRPDVNDNTGRRLRGKLTNRLYHNNHDGTFTDVTEKAGVGGRRWLRRGLLGRRLRRRRQHRSVCAATTAGNILYHNNGNGTFTDVTKKAGLSMPHGRPAPRCGASPECGSTTTATAGWISSLPTTWNTTAASSAVIIPRRTAIPGPLSYNGTAGILYRNNGDGTFTDVTKKAGVYNPAAAR